jgi:hypothetical protein
LLYKIMSESPARAGELNPRLPAPVEDVLDRALSKEPGKRFPSCGAFVKALEDACAALAEDALGERKKTDPVPPPDSHETSVARLSLEQLRKVESTKNLSFGGAPPAPQPAPRSNRMLLIGAVAAVVLALVLVAGMMLGGGGSSGTNEPEKKGEGPIVLAENGAKTGEPEAATAQPETQQPVETAAAPPPVAAPPKAAPKSTALQPQATPQPSTTPTVVTEAPLLVGATITIVWRGQLDPGAELRIDGDKASIGEISRGLPGEPVQIEVSPNVLEILEAPSAENNWSKLRLLNGGDRVRRYFLIRCKSL